MKRAHGINPSISGIPLMAQVMRSLARGQVWLYFCNHMLLKSTRATDPPQAEFLPDSDYSAMDPAVLNGKHYQLDFFEALLPDPSQAPHPAQAVLSGLTWFFSGSVLQLF